MGRAVRRFAAVLVLLAIASAGLAAWTLRHGPQVFWHAVAARTPLPQMLEWASLARGALVFTSTSSAWDCRHDAATDAVSGDFRFQRTIDPDTEIVIAAVGDLLIQTSYLDQADTHPDGFRSLWHGTEDLMRGADVTYANLEGVIAENVDLNGNIVTPPARRSDRRVYTGFPRYNAPPDYASALAALGVDVVSTANNHALDRGPEGVRRTLAALEAVNIRATGTRPDKRGGRARQWHTVTEVKGRSIAWLACSWHTNALDTEGQVLNCRWHADEVMAVLGRLKDDPGIDAVILTPHWGLEYEPSPHGGQRAFGRAAVEAGADAVIGAHPHVVQPMEVYESPSGRRGVIAYSTGNFVGGFSSLSTRSAIILLLGFAEADDGRLVPAGARYIPIRMIYHGERASGRITVEAVDRRGRPAAANRAHLADIIPAGLIHPPYTPLSAVRTCRDPLVAALPEGTRDRPRP